MASTRVGVSAKQIQRETGVTYKTAWRMMKQVRQLMAEKITLEGQVEADEAEFGGSDSNKPLHLRGKAKTIVLGMVERGGRVVTEIVPNSTALALAPNVPASGPRRAQPSLPIATRPITPSPKAANTHT